MKPKNLNFSYYVNEPEIYFDRPEKRIKHEKEQAAFNLIVGIIEVIVLFLLIK